MIKQIVIYDITIDYEVLENSYSEVLSILTHDEAIKYKFVDADDELQTKRLREYYSDVTVDSVLIRGVRESSEIIFKDIRLEYNGNKLKRITILTGVADLMSDKSNYKKINGNCIKFIDDNNDIVSIGQLYNLAVMTGSNTGDKVNKIGDIYIRIVNESLVYLMEKDKWEKQDDK